jgi:hypothetical protein
VAGFYRARIARGYPDPDPFTFCLTCQLLFLQRQRIASMVPAPSPPPSPPTKQELEARLRRAEATQQRAQKRAEKIRQQLTDTDD